MDQPRSILRLAEQEDKNLQRGLELFEDTYDIITDLETLYDTLPRFASFLKTLKPTLPRLQPVYTAIWFSCAGDN
jgi:hypothetical protein